MTAPARSQRECGPCEMAAAANRMPRRHLEWLRGASTTVPYAGMVVGMASRKITVTVDEEQLLHIRTLVDAGRVASVSGFVQHAVGLALDDVAGWGAMLARALDETGGPMSADERAWADAALGVPKRRGRSAA